jgi:hypothetical protein
MNKELVQATHYPHKLMHVLFLACSCGFEGIVPVDEETVKGDEVDEVVHCPNCKSKTVHPKHLTETPTTDHHYSDGSKETLVASKEEVKQSIVPTATPTADDVARIVMQHPMFDRLNNFLNEQDKKKVSETNSTKGVTE